MPSKKQSSLLNLDLLAEKPHERINFDGAYNHQSIIGVIYTLLIVFIFILVIIIRGIYIWNKDYPYT